MSTNGHPLSRAEALRQEFDQSFVLPIESSIQEYEDLVLIRLAGDPYALNLREISGLIVGKRITPLPNVAPSFLGIAGYRGEIIPVYSLHTLLGYDGNSDARWFAVVRNCALAFEAYDAYERVLPQDIVGTDRQDDNREFLQTVARIGSTLRPIIRISALLDHIERRLAALPAEEEEK